MPEEHKKVEEQKKQAPSKPVTAFDMQLFQLAVLTSMIDSIRFRVQHLEVTWKGDKAGPYEASQIPPVLTAHKAYEKLKGMLKGCLGHGPEVDEVLMGSAVVPHGEEEEAPGEQTGKPMPAITELPFELEQEEQPPKAEAPAKPKPPAAPPREERVVTLEPVPPPKPGEEGDEGIIELDGG